MIQIILRVRREFPSLFIFDLKERMIAVMGGLMNFGVGLKVSVTASEPRRAPARGAQICLCR